MDAQALLNDSIMKNPELSRAGISRLTVSCCDAHPEMVPREIAELVVKRLKDGFCVAGSSAEASFQNLLGIISALVPNAALSANRLRMTARLLLPLRFCRKR